MYTWKPTPLESEQRVRAYAALYAAGYSKDRAQSRLRQALKDAPRNQRASTTFRKVADAVEAANAKREVGA